MNKFGDMMEFLFMRDASFEQVIAVDAQFDLFNRAWCILELAIAHRMGMKQHLKLLNFRCLEENSKQLRSLKVEHMTASRAEDIQEILSHVPDKASFNKNLQRLLFDKLIPQWNNLDALDQMFAAGQLTRWSNLSEQRLKSGHSSDVLKSRQLEQYVR
jgi:hypothetical protein